MHPLKEELNIMAINIRMIANPKQQKHLKFLNGALE